MSPTRDPGAAYVALRCGPARRKVQCTYNVPRTARSASPWQSAPAPFSQARMGSATQPHGGPTHGRLQEEDITQSEVLFSGITQGWSCHSTCTHG